MRFRGPTVGCDGARVNRSGLTQVSERRAEEQGGGRAFAEEWDDPEQGEQHDQAVVGGVGPLLVIVKPAFSPEI